MRHRCFAVSAPGLEALVAAELAELGIRPGAPAAGGVPFGASTRQLYASNAWLRTATRVLVRAGSFRARSFAELEARARQLPWERWIGVSNPPRFRVTSRASRLYHTGAIAERLARVTGDVVAPDGGQLVVVRITRDKVTVSVDSSGEPLHKRGWRTQIAKAPLRETLAAAMLLATGWSGALPLLDPFCGSGTIPIEAAQLAQGLAPGRNRSFAFQRWPSFEPGTWAAVTAGLAGGDGARAPSAIIAGRDRDPGAIGAAIANARRAGVEGLVDLATGAVSNLEPPSDQAGWVICNPPYGRRLGSGGDLRDLYARFGAVMRERFGGWQVAMLAADRRLANHSGLPLRPLWTTTSGGIKVQLLATA